MAPAMTATPTFEQVKLAAEHIGLLDQAKAKGLSVKPLWQISIKAEGETFTIESPIKEKIRLKAKKFAKRDGWEVEGPYRINPFTKEKLPTVEAMKNSFHERVATLDKMVKEQTSKMEQAIAEDTAKKAKLDACDIKVIPSEGGPNLGGDTFAAPDAVVQGEVVQAVDLKTAQ